MKKKKARKHVKPRQPSLAKATADMTKLAVTGLVGASLISTIGTTMKNATKK